MNWEDFDAVLFDLDGVLTPTAEVHMRAWHKMFEEFLTTRPDAKPYTEADYFDHIDGKPRYEGVADFLASRDITLPQGTPDDHPNEETVCGLGNRKNDAFSEVLRRDGVEAYPGSVQLLDELDRRRIAMAVVSSSRNAPAVLAAAGIANRFKVVVDGNVAADEGLAGKPQPDTFVDAAAKLDVPVARAVVFEDATSGVRAGHAGGFGLVVGVDRGAGAGPLTAAGADRVVTDLAELIADSSDAQTND
ncbi:MAG: beta-phosphoglucomutase family hydrolase [Propionibacteriales bacterium]|nr:beta-phosphoglucomutase family hydrolase [Propionibacteriales bacterium]